MHFLELFLAHGQALLQIVLENSIMMFCNLMVGLITIALLFVQDIHWLLVALMIRSIFIVSIILHSKH